MQLEWEKARFDLTFTKGETLTIVLDNEKVLVRVKEVEPTRVLFERLETTISVTKGKE